MACRLIPSEPYLVLGQYGGFDSSRAPAGKETAWAYTHVPQEIRGDAGGELTGSWDERETEIFAERIEQQVEALAPGFRDLIRGRHVFTPTKLEQANRNLVNGALNGGTAQLHQQLVFRPVPGLARPETPIEGLYLGSASIHPGRRRARRTGGQRGRRRARGLALAGAAPPLSRMRRTLSDCSFGVRRLGLVERVPVDPPGLDLDPSLEPSPGQIRRSSPPPSSTCAAAPPSPSAAGRA